MADQVMLDVGEDEKTVVEGDLQLSDQERQILELYDRLEEIKLESSYLEALNSLPAESEDRIVTDEELETARKELLEAKALYTLRSNIVNSILIANPVLKAVHSGNNATPVERDLLPLIQVRDELSVKLTDLSAKTLIAREALTKTQVEHASLARRNAESAAEMLKLAEAASSQKKDDVKDPELRAQLDELELEVKRSRQRRRMMKGVTSAVVAGSGVDWARDKTLRELVLDNDDDDF